MRVIAVLWLCAATTYAAVGQDQVQQPVLIDPDFGLTLATPDGFDARLIGQTPDGLVSITVTASDPELPALDPSGDLCDITFQYDPSFGQGDQAWVNAHVEGTGFYERAIEEVSVPGTVESGRHFSHRGASGYRYEGQHELGGTFAVAAIPSPEGFVLVTCLSAAQVSDWDVIDPVIDALTVPGQPRGHLVASGRCDSDVSAIQTLFEGTDGGLLAPKTIAALDVERNGLAEQCGGLHAEDTMDEATANAGYDSTYRGVRYDSLAQIGSDLLTQEQHQALDDAREQVVETSDEGSGDRYIRYMQFIVGLRSLDQ